MMFEERNLRAEKRLWEKLKKREEMRPRLSNVCFPSWFKMPAEVNLEECWDNEFTLYGLVNSRYIVVGGVVYKLLFDIRTCGVEKLVVFMPEPVLDVFGCSEDDSYSSWKAKNKNMYQALQTIFDEDQEVFKEFMEYLIQKAYPSFLETGRIPLPFQLPSEQQESDLEDFDDLMEDDLDIELELADSDFEDPDLEFLDFPEE